MANNVEDQKKFLYFHGVKPTGKHNDGEMQDLSKQVEFNGQPENASTRVEKILYSVETKYDKRVSRCILRTISI